MGSLSRRQLSTTERIAAILGPACELPMWIQFFRPRATGRIEAAQEHVRQHRGGIIWHTQGSGKSIVMVLLAKWILENNPNARVAIITDRDELDKQIEGSTGATGRQS